MRLKALMLAGLALVVPMQGEPRAAERETLTIGMTQFPSSFHPATDSMLAKSIVLGMANRPITAYDKDWTLVCLLCTELPTVENGLATPEDLADGRKGIAVTYTLKPGLAWGDGVPVTAKDVVFTWTVGRHPMSGFSDGEMYRRILSIDAKDERTFTLHLDRMTFDYNAAGFNVLPAHVEAPAFADPQQYRVRTAFDTDPTRPGLYNGPYRVVEVARGSHIVLERNPAWGGPKPAFNRIAVRTIENTAALEANLLSGGVDYIAGELGLALDQALSFEKRHGDAYTAVYKPTLAYEHITLNLDNPVLKDPRVRRALLLGLDREQLDRRLFAGKQPVAHSLLPPADPMHGDGPPRLGHAPKEAAALLDEAGWRLGAGGLRRDESGKTLTIELSSTAGNRTREMVEQVLQAQWKAIGVDVRIKNEPARVLFGESLTKRRFPAMAMFAWSSSPQSSPRSTLHSSMIPTAANNWAGQNFSGYARPEMDQLIDALEVELDADRRRGLWSRLQALYAQDLPALPLYFRADAFIIPKWLKGVEPTGHQDPTTLWVETWRAEGG